jgi:alkanesulfonate monooxygenase SsuD/methylene tetrahydromethanopterin reductase-like flavin-dependent oxidoreductase (luciferase family)
VPPGQRAIIGGHEVPAPTAPLEAVVRFGLTILPERPWAQARHQWRAAEDLGFDHAWTYDHLVWAGLPDAPWYGTTPTLTAAALETSRIGLGTFVASPNFRHPATLHRDVQSLDDISWGRFLLGLGKGGDLDARILGQPALTTRDRVDRFQEFTRLYLRLRDDATGHVTSEGRWFEAHDMGTLPRVDRVPVLAAADGPRSVRFAAEVADGWVTTGSRSTTLDEWFDGLERSVDTLEEALAAAGRDRAAYPRYLNLDSSPVYSLGSAERFEEMVTRAGMLRFTDVVSHWPRATEPYRGDEAMLETIATQVMPRLRG